VTIWQLPPEHEAVAFGRTHGSVLNGWLQTPVGLQTSSVRALASLGQG
jgi:hypothetical protein